MSLFFKKITPDALQKGVPVTADSFGQHTYYVSRAVKAGMKHPGLLAFKRDLLKDAASASIMDPKYKAFFQAARKMYEKSPAYEKKYRETDRKSSSNQLASKYFEVSLSPCFKNGTSLSFPFVGMDLGHLEEAAERIPFELYKEKTAALLLSWFLINRDIFHKSAVFSDFRYPLNDTRQIIDNLMNNEEETQIDGLCLLSDFLKVQSFKHIEPVLKNMKNHFAFEALFVPFENQLFHIIKKVSTLITGLDDLYTITVRPDPFSFFSAGTFLTSFEYDFERIHYTSHPVNLFTGKNVTILKKYADRITKTAESLTMSFQENCNVEIFIDGNQNDIYLSRLTVKEDAGFEKKLKIKKHLIKKKKLTEKELIKNITSDNIKELLYSELNPHESDHKTVVQTGITGSPGAASGRVFFSADRLLEAYEKAVSSGDKNPGFILAMPATYAGEVRAIKVAKAIISSEGGYASHAPVVARSLGKVSLVSKDISFQSKRFKIGKKTVKENDVISVECKTDGTPKIFFGEVPFTDPDYRANGLLDLIGLLKKYETGKSVYCNADRVGEGKQGLLLGADGIGLCRTEHMFFDQTRLKYFLAMIFADDKKIRHKAEKKIFDFQTKDFQKIFTAYNDRFVTIRLLDAPLHEFIPSDTKGMKEVFDVLKALGDTEIKSVSELKKKAESYKEINPMLGSRGLRIAMDRLDIYRMQVKSIFNAVLKVRKKGQVVNPGIMLPMVSHVGELEFLLYGKKIEGEHIEGLKDTCSRFLKEQSFKKSLNYEFGAMIETPGACVEADKIAEHVSFLSFGTNDLTQMVLGMSRDDNVNLLSHYQKYGIMPYNPFSYIHQSVLELIKTAVIRAKAVRPDMKISVCGEHGGNSDNFTAFKDAGITYISCQPRAVPEILLAAVHRDLSEKI